MHILDSGFECLTPRDHLVKNTAKAKDVAARVGFSALQHFRRKVLKGAND